jgi:hypothetical protein
MGLEIWGKRSSSLRKNPRHSEDLLIQFFYRESAEACMRGVFSDQGRLFSYLSPEARVELLPNFGDGGIRRQRFELAI